MNTQSHERSGIPFCIGQRMIRKKEFGTKYQKDRQASLIKKQENVLAEHILQLGKKCHDLTRSKVRKTAFQYTEHLKLPHYFKKVLKRQVKFESAHFSKEIHALEFKK